MNLKDVEKLCVMLQCSPNDLLEWIPDTKDAKNEKHPLATLKRKDSFTQLNLMLKDVPLDKLSAIENLIKQELNKD